MNQPASKEPTMDEILSSIRQIIADDDESANQKMPAAKAQVVRPAAVPEPKPEPEATPAVAEQAIDPFSDDDDDVPPLALSPDQIVSDTAEEVGILEPEVPSAASLDAAELVVPDDVAFDLDEDDASAPQPEPLSEPEWEPEPAMVAEAVSPSISQSAPMPDRDLSADLAEELLEPATSAAVKSAFARLNTPKLTPDMALSANGMTIEAMIREMLRPMLKDWLEENLPSMVERIVAQEIERVSRGG